MTKMMSIHDSVAEVLDEIKEEFETKHGVRFSYSNTIKKVLREADRWEEPTDKKKSKKMKSKKHSSDDDEE